MIAWCLWSELNGGWLGPGAGWCIPSLMRAGLYSQTDAEQIMRQDNRHLPAGVWHVWAMPDPLGRTI
jgi:hypothetical protein